MTWLETEGNSTLLPQADISALQVTKQKLQGFKDLERGWHYGEGDSIEQAIINNAMGLNREAIRSGFLETDAFPGLNGEVMFTIYSDDHYLEFTLESDGSVTYYRERGSEQVSYQEGLSFQDAKQKIQQFRMERWTQSGSLIEDTTIPEKVDLPVSHLRIQRETEGSQLLAQSVSSRPEEISVSISESIINWLQVIPQFSGVSRQKYYLEVSG